ncbi:unnamed protein product [Adineta ricciae]|uniref:Protein kinase domain-containing protein n=1 Tax=Adineta ricciae TaxID=249248 RepID=A0A815XUY7_ADIRI|nr:unnamed protein product [Adineta ricciae]
MDLYRISLNTLRSQSQYKEDVDIEIGEKLMGASGKIFYRARWLNGRNSPIVVLEMTGEGAAVEIIRYISLDHPNIIKTHGTITPNPERERFRESVLLLQEYAEDGDLWRLLNGRVFIPSSRVLLEIFIQICCAMIYLSDHQIIHGDLACRNVLVVRSHPTDPKGNLVKLIDFGLTQDLSNSSMTEIIYPIRYAAPEIIASGGLFGYSQASDVYSFAVLMWEAYSSEKNYPYDSIFDDNEVAQRKRQGELLPKPPKCDADIWALMLECWKERADDRPDFKSIHTQLLEIQQTERSSSMMNLSFDGRQTSLYRSNYELQGDFGRGNSVEANSHRYSLSSSEYESDDNEFDLCNFCHQQFSTGQINIHENNCLQNPKNQRTNRYSSNKSRSNSRMYKHYGYDSSRLSSFDRPDDRPPLRYTSEISINTFDKRMKSARVVPIHPIENLRTEELPCEICNKLFPASEYSQHQAECVRRDQNRIESIRLQIQNERDVTTVICQYCQRNCLINNLNDHEATCLCNPFNMFESQPPLTLTRSVSTPGIYQNYSETKSCRTGTKNSKYLNTIREHQEPKSIEKCPREKDSQITVA